MDSLRTFKLRMLEVAVLVILVSMLVTCRRPAGRETGERNSATATPIAQMSPTAGSSSSRAIGDNRAEQQRPRPVVSGQIFLRERISFPADARVRIRVIRVGQDHSASETIASVELIPPRRLPIPFEVVCDPRTIDENAAYGLEAQIVRRGTVIFTTPAPTPVLAGGEPTTGLKLLLQRTG